MSDNPGLLPVIQFAGAEAASQSVQIDKDQAVVKEFVIILVNAKQPIHKEYNAQERVMIVFQGAGLGGQEPMTNFVDLEIVYFRTYITTLTETQCVWEKVIRIAGE